VDTVTDVKPSTQDAVLDIMDSACDSGLTVEVNGAGMQSMAPPGGESELVGIAVALVVLVLNFGALVSAGVPIVTAVWGVALGLTGVTAMIAFTDDCEEAVGVAVGTGGSAVVFAGLTVLIALSALAVVQMPFLTAMGLAPRRPC